MLLEWIVPANLTTLHSTEEALPENMTIPDSLTTAFSNDLDTLAMHGNNSLLLATASSCLAIWLLFIHGLQLHPDKIVIVELGPANPDRPDHIIVRNHAWQACAPSACTKSLERSGQPSSPSEFIMYGTSMMYSIPPSMDTGRIRALKCPC
jgi:hypothetical protein